MGGVFSFKGGIFPALAGEEVCLHLFLMNLPWWIHGALTCLDILTGEEGGKGHWLTR